MALKHSPLDATQLSPAAQKVLGAPGPMKMMAARGLAPLPRPADLVSVLYQLSLDAEAPIKAAAQKSAAELPDKVLTGALADTGLDPRVLDYFAGLVAGKPELIELVILNRSTGDETVAELATRGSERDIELIVANEQRMLRHPAIVGAMYMNKNARMSTVDRAVELAVRNNVKVPGIPAWDEVVAAVLGTKKQAPVDAEKVDAVFAAAAKAAIDDEPAAPTKGMTEAEVEAATLAAATGQDGEAEKEEAAVDIPISEMTIPMKIRLATLGNKFARSQLIRDANKMVAMAAIKAPGVTEMEAAKHAGNNGLAEDVITYISLRRDWVKQYGVKYALVGNPKTPLATAMRFLTHLREKDLRNIARSKGIPTALATQAKKLIAARSSGGKG
jgi:hypothetical protein